MNIRSNKFDRYSDFVLVGFFTRDTGQFFCVKCDNFGDVYQESLGATSCHAIYGGVEFGEPVLMPVQRHDDVASTYAQATSSLIKGSWAASAYGACCMLHVVRCTPRVRCML